MKITCKSRYKQIKAKLLLCDDQGVHNCNVGMDLWESIWLCHRPHGGNTSPDVGVSPSYVFGESRIVILVSAAIGMGPTLGLVADLSIIIVLVYVMVCVNSLD